MKLKNWFDFSSNPPQDIPKTVSDVEPMDSCVIILNGQDRFSSRKGDFFRFIEPYKGNNNIPEKIIYNYNFCLNGSDFQPSGFLNFSMIDSAIFDVYTIPVEIKQIIF